MAHDALDKMRWQPDADMGDPDVAAVEKVVFAVFPFEQSIHPVDMGVLQSLVLSLSQLGGSRDAFERALNFFGNPGDLIVEGGLELDEIIAVYL